MTTEMLCTFQGMPGVRRPLKGPMRKTPSGFLDALREHRACSHAGSEGSVLVWIDDRKDYRCHFGSYLTTVDQQTFKTKAAVRRWLREWLPRVEP